MKQVRVAVLSDVHYASAGERARPNYWGGAISNPARRLLIQVYRRYYWQRDPFAHNHLLDEFIARALDADFVVANGDYSCDTGFVGLSDQAAAESAAECLGKLRKAFPTRFHATIGDHELGKKPLGADLGGLRLSSYHRARQLGLEPFWTVDLGRFILLGVTSTLLALPVFEPEALSSEMPAWHELRQAHLAQVRAAFAALKPHQKVILFCHDPTALPFLADEAVVRTRLAQVERTILGHLHSPLVLWQSRVLAGMPVLSFLGHTPKRLSKALRQARSWKPFRVLLCPSLSGIELLKDGGYCTLTLDLDGSKPPDYQMQRLRRGAALAPK